MAIGPGNPYTLLIVDGDRLRMVTRIGQDPWSMVPYTQRPSNGPANATSPAVPVQVPGVLGGGSAITATDADILSLNQVATLAGAFDDDGEIDGHGYEARFDKPRGVAASLSDGRIYVADSLRCRIRLITTASIVATPITCGTRALDLVAPPGCSSYDPSTDSVGQMTTPLRSDSQYNRVNVTSPAGSRVFDGAAWVTPEGRSVPYCLGRPPPDVSISSSGVTLGPVSGTGATAVDADEDAGQGTVRLVLCPPGCIAATSSPVQQAVYGGWGGSGSSSSSSAGVYDDASSVCLAAIHAGVIDVAAGGTIHVTYGKGYGPSAGASSPSYGSSAGLSGSTVNGVTSLAVADSLRTFTLSNYTVPTQRIEVQTIAGAPAAPLDSACGFLDGQPPLAARFAGPAAIAVNRHASVSSSNPLIVADARNNAIRSVSAVCSFPCENGGNCTGPEQCSCAAGWSGVDCTVPVCSAVPCGPRRLCTGPDTCTCPPGYSGPNCDAAQCMQACSNGGTCIAPDTCACRLGWFDANCTTPVCSQTCGNGGNCTAPDTCTCPAWWSGADCRTPLCPQGCNGVNGYCSAPNTCTCDPSWSGHDCSKPVCHQGYWRPDPAPQHYAPPGTARPVNWNQFLPCDYRRWCDSTDEFECYQLLRMGAIVPAAPLLQRNVSGWGVPPSSIPPDGCMTIEVDKDLRTPYRTQNEWGDVSAYMRLSGVHQYGWGPPPPNSHAWSAPGPAANDRQIALVSYSTVPQGVYLCANGGNCTAPDYCVCAPGWAGFDCRTPVCTQGYWFPRDY